MMVFLIGSIYETSIILDKSRRFKQCVECKQIISIIEKKQENSNIKIPYENHPIVLSWFSYLNALKVYYNMMLYFAINIDKVNTKMEYYNTPELIERPWFLDYLPLIYSHRARLYQKDPIFYKDKFYMPPEYLSIGYIWINRFPINKYYDVKTFDDIKLLADNLDPKYINSKYCPGVIKSGKNKGKQCGKLLKLSSNFCGIHKK